MKVRDCNDLNVNIRSATLGDAINLGQIYAECFPFLFNFAYGAGPEKAGCILGDFYSERVLPLSNVHLAETQGSLAGFAVLRLGEGMPHPGAGAYWRVLRRHLGPVRSVRAFMGSFIVSFVFSGRTPNVGIAYLDTLGVVEDQRNKGIGTSLLEHCFQLAKDAKCTQIALHVMQKNEDAKRLYERMGFVARPDERRLPRILSIVSAASRAWLMVKELDA